MYRIKEEDEGWFEFFERTSGKRIGLFPSQGQAKGQGQGLGQEETPSYLGSEDGVNQSKSRRKGKRPLKEDEGHRLHNLRDEEKEEEEEVDEDEDKDKDAVDETSLLPSDIEGVAFPISFGRKNIKFNSTMACMGCEEEFPCYRTSPELKGQRTIPCPDYYIHCIKHCDRYKALGLMRWCVDCNLTFINPWARASHLRSAHPKI